MAEKKELIKNIPFSEAVDIKGMVDYEEGRVVSRTLASKPGINITLFAFDKKEEISTHTSPGDAMVTMDNGNNGQWSMGVGPRYLINIYGLSLQK